MYLFLDGMEAPPKNISPSCLHCFRVDRMNNVASCCSSEITGTESQATYCYVLGSCCVILGRESCVASRVLLSTKCSICYPCACIPHTPATHRQMDVHTYHFLCWMTILDMRQSLIRTSLLCFYFYMLCYAAVLLKFTYYYAQYYAQEQGLLPDYNYDLCCSYTILHEQFTTYI